MTNILIPTDFTERSITFARHVAQSIPGSVNIYLFHAFEMPDSLIDAMHRAGLSSYNRLITEELRIRCKKAKSQQKNIQNISFRVMHGNTISTFRSFADALKIDFIAVPAGYKFIPVVKESVNPERMFRKSGLEVASSFPVRTEKRIQHTVSERSFNRYSFVGGVN